MKLHKIWTCIIFNIMTDTNIEGNIEDNIEDKIEDNNEFIDLSSIKTKNIIDIENNVFQYRSKNYTVYYILKNNKYDAWININDCANKNNNDDIKFVDNFIKNDKNKKDILSHEQILNLYDPTNEKILHNTSFLNSHGFINLMSNGNHKTKKSIKKWLRSDLYLSDKNKPQEDINFELFFDNSTISSYFEKFVVYIGCTGKINGKYFYKYGISERIYKRVFEEHSKTYPNFEILFVQESNNRAKVEKLFGYNLKAIGLHRTHKKYGKELFTTSNKYSINDLINNMKNIIKENELNPFKEFELEIENNKTKLEIKKLEVKEKELEIEKIKLNNGIFNI